jgi:hypothetical protein
LRRNGWDGTDGCAKSFGANRVLEADRLRNSRYAPMPKRWHRTRRSCRSRRRIRRALVESDFTAALEKALRLAKSAETDYLPGWCGPIAEG